MPYLLKDLACEMEGVRFTEGSRFLAGYVSAFDSELVVRLRRAGLVILGKTSTPEFGMAGRQAGAIRPGPQPVGRSAPQRVQRRVHGGGGVGHGAVRARNDLGGSLRYPASACGLFALKPTRPPPRARVR